MKLNNTKTTFSINQYQRAEAWSALAVKCGEYLGDRKSHAAEIDDAADTVMQTYAAIAQKLNQSTALTMATDI